MISSSTPLRVMSFNLSVAATSSMDALSWLIFSISSCLVCSGSLASSSRKRGSRRRESSPIRALEICRREGGLVRLMMMGVCLSG